jgi:RNA polymerase sigma factor (sigma-70 family)
MSINHLNDVALIEQYIAGNEACLEVLITRHQRQVFSFILKHVKEREVAEDIFQDVFIKVIRHLKTDLYREEGKFLPWVLRIAHNLVHDYFRAQQKFRQVSTPDDYDMFERLVVDYDNVQEKIQRTQYQKEIRQWIAHLPYEIRQVVIMRTFLDLSFKEIASITNVPINTALGRMRNGVLKLRKLCAEEKVAKKIA